MQTADVTAGAERRRRIRRSALVWALIAVGFYVGFILMAVLRSVK